MGGASAVEPHLQRIIEAPVVVPRPRQKGGSDRRPRSGGDVEECAGGRAGGWAAQGGGGDAGEVDSQRESGLFQSFLWNSEGFQLLLPVGHVGVLTAAADTVQTRLQQQTTKQHVNDHRSAPHPSINDTFCFHFILQLN